MATGVAAEGAACGTATEDDDLEAMRQSHQKFSRLSDIAAGFRLFCQPKVRPCTYLHVDKRECQTHASGLVMGDVVSYNHI